MKRPTRRPDRDEHQTNQLFPKGEDKRAMADLNPVVFAHVVQMKAESSPDFPVLTFEYGDLGDEVVTYGRLFANAHRFAKAFQDLGLELGDRVGVFLRNYPEFVVTLAGNNTLGFVSVPLDPRLVGEKLAFQLNDSGVKVLVTTPDLLGAVLEIQEKLPKLKAIVVAEKPGLPLLKDLEPETRRLRIPIIQASEILARPEVLLGQKAEPMTPYAIMYTSGTTGDPKGVLQPTLGIWATSEILGRRVFHYQSDDKLYTGLSLTHGNANAVTLSPAVFLEIKAVFSPRFTKSRIWDICRKYGCTSFSLLGGMMTSIYGEPERPNDGDNPVRIVASAGTPPSLWEAFERRFQVKILEWYGAVDGGCICYKPVGDGPIGSFGKPLEDFCEVRVVNENDQDVTPFERGEMIGRFTLMETKIDYWGKPEESAKKTRGGWVRSGDIVYKDDQGWLFFCHRKGAEIRRYGDFIQPDAIEKALIEHPRIDDVCVYGVPSKAGAPGEKDVVAALVLQDEGLDLEALADWCRERLEKSHVPSYFQVVKEIPKTPSERPLTRLLEEDLARGAGTIYAVEGKAYLGGMSAQRQA